MLGVTGVARYTIRALVGQLVKLFPIVGYGSSAVITYGLTIALGKSSIAFYLENKSEVEVQALFEKAKREAEMQAARQEEEDEDVFTLAPVDNFQW